MEEGATAAARYWCYVCSQNVDPVDGDMEIQCPLCGSGFIEEMDGNSSESDNRHDSDPEFWSDPAFIFWGPILLGITPHRTRPGRMESSVDNDDGEDEGGESHREGDTELDREIDAIFRRRATVASEDDDGDQNGGEGREGDNDGDGDVDEDGDLDRDGGAGHVAMINPSTQTLIMGESNLYSSQNWTTSSSLGDFIYGVGFDMLMQHLAENDPSNYGSPPAQKEAIEAMPLVTVEEKLQCSVCLNDFEIGAEARKMPCEHKFHAGCILPWLELHSSCPICRYQLPAQGFDGSS
ncbi:hypothetical protein SAY87_017987 [Trapa incisa]|uniref:RING-type E3 ubiquitin transferase n=1 Tax=Trapa incisa TaxID=236973 RepID=A0AAN7QVU5_9MYRT|nr:hypothetical protein SAY87_017987 [Trapa incisa]